MPNGNIEGNGAVAVSYTANGEASDYFLGTKGIYALSPELGTKSKNSETFFINKESDLLDVLT